jgi:hypothetical protein
VQVPKGKDCEVLYISVGVCLCLDDSDEIRPGNGIFGLIDSELDFSFTGRSRDDH